MAKKKQFWSRFWSLWPKPLLVFDPTKRSCNVYLKRYISVLFLQLGYHTKILFMYKHSYQVNSSLARTGIYSQSNLHHLKLLIMFDMHFFHFPQKFSDPSPSWKIEPPSKIKIFWPSLTFSSDFFLAFLTSPHFGGGSTYLVI